MGRDKSFVAHMVAYGVTIKVPRNPAWTVMNLRLANYQHHETSLFAAAARVIGKKGLDDEESRGLPKQITKRAKLSIPPTVLISISNKRQMTKEEKKSLKFTYMGEAEEEEEDDDDKEKKKRLQDNEEEGGKSLQENDEDDEDEEDKKGYWRNSFGRDPEIQILALDQVDVVADDAIGERP